MDWKFLIAKTLYPQVFEKRDEYYDIATYRKNEIDKLLIEISELEQINIDLRTKQHTLLEEYCIENYTEVPKFAYKDKYKASNGFVLSVYPNEFICPDLFEIERVRNSLQRDKYDFYNWARIVGEYVDKRLRWTSDLTTQDLLDNYANVYDTLAEVKQDCENHCFLACSIEPEFGFAFGFWNGTGHAFVVFVYDDILYGLETNSIYDINNNVRIFKYGETDEYIAHWIFTKNKTFKCIARPRSFGTKP